MEDDDILKLARVIGLDRLVEILPEEAIAAARQAEVERAAMPPIADLAIEPWVAR